MLISTTFKKIRTKILCALTLPIVVTAGLIKCFFEEDAGVPILSAILEIYIVF